MTVDSVAATTTSGRVYPVAADKSGYLSVNVPWTAVTETTVRNWGFTKNEGTLTDVDLFVGGPDAKEDGATTNGNTYLNLLMNSGIRSVHNIVGSGHTTVTSDASGTITINSTVPDISNLVPYTGASKDVNLGNHSLLISNKTSATGVMVKVSGKQRTENDTSVTIEPDNITLAGAGDDTTILNNSGFKAQIRADTDGDGQLDTTYYSMYEYGGIIHNDKTLSFPEKGGTLAVTDDLLTLLDKGTPSTAVNQIVYNPVEMKKNLTVPSLSGEKTTIAGNSISTFRLGGTKDESTAMSDLTLVGFSGTSSINNVYTTHIQQLSDGTFQIVQRHGNNVTGTLIFRGDWWRMNGYDVFTGENLKKATNTDLGLIKPWYSTTGKSTYNGSSIGPGAGSDTPSINTRSTTSGRYYLVEMDANGRAYVNVRWTIPNATYDTRGLVYLGRAIHIDGTGYSTHGYYYDRNSDIQICFGTTMKGNGLMSVTFARKFKGAPTVVLEPFFKSTTSTSIGTQYRNAQTVRCYLVNGSATTSYSKTNVVTGFQFDSGNNEDQYFNYIAIGQSTSNTKYDNPQYEEPYVPPEQ